MRTYIKKSIFILVAVFGIYGIWYLVSPLFVQTYINEELPQGLINESGTASGTNKKTLENLLIARGQFKGFDTIHNGTGTVSIYSVQDKVFLRFEDGFQVNNGPDLYVGFGKNGSYVKGSEISKLKATNGAQNYEIPSGVPVSMYDSVYVWCKAFSTPFIKADVDMRTISTVSSHNTQDEMFKYVHASTADITVNLPYPGAVVGKTFSVIGKARGPWFFEGSFPVEIRDVSGILLAQSVAVPQTVNTEWMTTDFVPFKADVQIPETYIGAGTVILKKDNPSGLSQNDASVSFPITIEY